MVQIANVSNPAAWGAEVTTDDGARIQFVQPRGTDSVHFGMYRDREKQWGATIPVDAPARFGPHAFTKWQEVKSWVEAFMNAATTDDDD